MEKSTAFFAYTKKYNKKNAYIQFSDAGWVAILLGIFMFCAIFIPYIIVAFRGTINPLLPFISQAAGSPPQSGIFSIFLALSATVGFFGLHLLHLGICIFQERVPKEKQRMLQFFNKTSLIPGHLALLGMIVVGGYPIDFHRHSEDWILVTIGPHLAGACMLFGGGVMYCSILTIMMTITFPEKQKLLGIRIFLLISTILTALIHAFTVQKAFHLEYYDEDRLKLCHLKPFEYDNNYLICSICEWVMSVTFVSFFLTIRDEGKLMSVTLSVDLLESDTEIEESSDFSKSPSPSCVSSEGPLCHLEESRNVINDNQDESIITKS